MWAHGANFASALGVLGVSVWLLMRTQQSGKEMKTSEGPWGSLWLCQATYTFTPQMAMVTVVWVVRRPYGLALLSLRRLERACVVDALPVLGYGVLVPRLDPVFTGLRAQEIVSDRVTMPSLVS